MKKIVIIGGVGNGTVIASTIEDCKDRNIDIECVGFLNDIETEISGYPVLGKIQNNDWKKLPDDYLFIWALSTVKKNPERCKILESLNIPINRFATIIHPTAVVSKKAELGYGVVIMPLSHVGPNVILGNHTQMYAQSFIGHDSKTEEFAFMASNSKVSSSVLVGYGSHLGINCSIREKVNIGKFAVVGMGAVVVKDVEDFDIVVGNPAKFLKKV